MTLCLLRGEKQSVVSAQPFDFSAPTRRRTSGREAKCLISSFHVKAEIRRGPPSDESQPPPHRTFPPTHSGVKAGMNDEVMKSR